MREGSLHAVQQRQPQCERLREEERTYYLDNIMLHLLYKLSLGPISLHNGAQLLRHAEHKTNRMSEQMDGQSKVIRVPGREDNDCSVFPIKNKLQTTIQQHFVWKANRTNSYKLTGYYCPITVFSGPVHAFSSDNLHARNSNFSSKFSLRKNKCCQISQPL